MNLRPIGDRILIKPDANPEQTESGLWIREDRKPELTGTVVAVGFCTHPLKAEAEAVAARAAMWADEWKQSAWFDVGDDFKDFANVLAEAADTLRAVTQREPQVTVGDYVVFSWTAGQEVTIEHERYLMLREIDIMAVIEGVEV